MYTMSKIEKRRPKGTSFFAPIVSLFIALALITSAVKFVLNFRSLYYFDINYLKISQETGVSRDEIVNNYDALISYLKPSFSGELKFPTFPMSIEAKQHFVEVKNIFIMLNYLMYASIIISAIGIIICLVRKNNKFLKLSSLFLLILPILLAIPFAVNFDATFTAFHKIFFSNDYWLFDPNTDPIINVLPQPFFMHSAIVILVIITIESALLYWTYRRTNSKRVSSYY